MQVRRKTEVLRQIRDAEPLGEPLGNAGNAAAMVVELHRAFGRLRDVIVFGRGRGRIRYVGSNNALFGDDDDSVLAPAGIGEMDVYPALGALQDFETSPGGPQRRAFLPVRSDRSLGRKRVKQAAHQLLARRAVITEPLRKAVPPDLVLIHQLVHDADRAPPPQ